MATSIGTGTDNTGPSYISSQITDAPETFTLREGKKVYLIDDSEEVLSYKEEVRIAMQMLFDVSQMFHPS